VSLLLLQGNRFPIPFLDVSHYLCLPVLRTTRVCRDETGTGFSPPERAFAALDSSLALPNVEEGRVSPVAKLSNQNVLVSG